ncbi:hypothetical protein HMPREF3159_03515 [Brachybacterium sp. HMSC06H03]|uniref:hypothetical protein n=1 Tax=Brachybacterium sp. HMSC06H03 TaxID=1581127 RepID=UPI0008A3C910|nr:hypothetical protein [Brachybacterium sp. HMSC06H03]OFT62593.1 hypothetical protein HMPREF3159_03515 [Brachybacterium sp. HMSC06H03]
MNSRRDTLKLLAESDPYWRGYLDGMDDKHNVGAPDGRAVELAEANRLLQARLDRIEAERADRAARFEVYMATSRELAQYEGDPKPDAASTGE